MSTLLDLATNVAKGFEEVASPHATILPGFPRSIQLDEYSCGIRCAYMIMKYYKRPMTLKAIREEMKFTPEGVDEDMLRAFFLKQKMKATRINQVTVHRITEYIDEGLPVLVDMDLDHLVVVYGYNKTSLFVADPSINRSPYCRHTNRRFMSRWDGWAMRVENLRP
jgi:ABC-type bacteriocin/lantibiotic exporter with double-glycine peptidase domain